MKVRELIEMLGKADPEAEVLAQDVYADGDNFEITGMLFGAEPNKPDGGPMVLLTNEQD